MPSMEPPVDQHRLTYFLFCWMGMSYLLPWNVLLSVDKYWMHKFRDVKGGNLTEASTEPGGDVDSHRLSDLQLSWNSYMSMASMVPSLVILLLNSAFGHLLPKRLFVIGSLVAILAIIFATDTLTQIDTDPWQRDFLALTLVLVVGLSVAVAVVQGVMSGVAAAFPAAYMGGLVQGQAIGGILPAVTSVISISIPSTNVETPAFISFAVVCVILVVDVIGFTYVSRLPFYRFYANQNGQTEKVKAEPKSPTTSASGETTPLAQVQQPATAYGGDTATPPETATKSGISVFSVALSIWVWILAIAINFAITLALFPAITFRVETVNVGDDDDESEDWRSKYFIPVGCFLLFAIGDLVGRWLAARVCWPGPTDAGITACLAIARIIFVPLFLFCNVSPHNRVHTPILIRSDVAYLTLMAVFSISNGYIGLICMMFGPKSPRLQGQPVRQSIAGSILITSLMIGLAIGSLCSVLLIKAL